MLRPAVEQECDLFVHWWTAGVLSLAAAAALVLRRWTRREWTPRHQLALCFGASMSAALFGLLLVSLDEHRANTAFQYAVIAALVAAYEWMDRRLSSPSAVSAAGDREDL